jgi:hypothetical protein
MPVLVLLVLLILGSSGTAWALDPVDIGVEIHTGWSDFSNSGSSQNIDQNLDSHSIRGIGIEARRGRLSLELSADWIKTNVEQTFAEVFAILPILIIGQNVTMNGNLTIIPILLTERLHLGPEQGMFDPYIGGGGGYYILSYDPSSTETGLTGKTPVSGSPLHDIKFHNTIGAHLNFGLDIRITPDTVFTIDARYVWANAKISYQGNLAVLNAVASPLNLNGFVTTFGIKYYFKH